MAMATRPPNPHTHPTTTDVLKLQAPHLFPSLTLPARAPKPSHAYAYAHAPHRRSPLACAAKEERTSLSSEEPAEDECDECAPNGPRERPRPRPPPRPLVPHSRSRSRSRSLNRLASPSASPVRVPGCRACECECEAEQGYYYAKASSRSLPHPNPPPPPQSQSDDGHGRERPRAVSYSQPGGGAGAAASSERVRARARGPKVPSWSPESLYAIIKVLQETLAAEQAEKAELRAHTGRLLADVETLFEAVEEFDVENERLHGLVVLRNREVEVLRARLARWEEEKLEIV
ncbi:hypothetical protein H0H87_006780 [Tephrocybe sp. NHM501043]|nr:hypothetical protein H0H87_006780 [Tephrocybe sp. NHM501043]